MTYQHSVILSPQKASGKSGTHDKLRSEATVETHETFVMEHLTSAVETVLVQ